MVDTYGRWTEEKDYSKYPKEKWCDYDTMANWIREQGYKPETTMENIITIIFLMYEGELENNKEHNGYYAIPYEKCTNDYSLNILDYAEYIRENGGLKEFDYYA